jgi:Rod binding domain-containing protein
MGGLPLPATAESFPLDPKTVSSDQLKDGPESATQAMQQFVGETFYGMLLKQMRNTVIASDLFGNSSAKQMFESQLDQTLVQELATHHSEFLSRPIRI